MGSSDGDDWIPFVFWVTGVPGEWSADHLYNELRRCLIPQVQAVWILPAVPVGGHEAPTPNPVEALLILRSKADEQLFNHFVQVWLGTTRLLVVRQNYAELIRGMLEFQQEFVRRREAHLQNKTLLRAHQETAPASAAPPLSQALSSSAAILGGSVISSHAPTSVGRCHFRNSRFEFGSVIVTSLHNTITTATTTAMSCAQTVASSSTTTPFLRNNSGGSSTMMASRAAASGVDGNRNRGASILIGSFPQLQLSPPAQQLSPSQPSLSSSSIASATAAREGCNSSGAVSSQKVVRSLIPWVQQWPANWGINIGKDFISPLLFCGISIHLTAIEVREALEEMFGTVRFVLVFYRQFDVSRDRIQQHFTFGQNRCVVVFEDYSSQVDCLNTTKFQNIRPAAKDVQVTVSIMQDITLYAVQRFHERDEAVRRSLSSWKLPQLEQERKLCIRASHQEDQSRIVKRLHECLEEGWNLGPQRVYVLDCQNDWIKRVGMRMQLQFDLRYMNLFR